MHFDRDLSLLSFHSRVLAQAQDPSIPLLERLKFLCISSTNLDEFFEMVTVIQTNKLGYPVFVVAVGKEYWQGIMKWLQDDVCAQRGAVTKEELQIIQLVDSPEEALSLIKKFTVGK